MLFKKLWPRTSEPQSFCVDLEGLRFYIECNPKGSIAPFAVFCNGIGDAFWDESEVVRYVQSLAGEIGNK